MHEGEAKLTLADTAWESGISRNLPIVGYDNESHILSVQFRVAYSSFFCVFKYFCYDILSVSAMIWNVYARVLSPFGRMHRRGSCHRNFANMRDAAFSSAAKTENHTNKALSAGFTAVPLQ